MAIMVVLWWLAASNSMHTNLFTEWVDMPVIGTFSSCFSIKILMEGGGERGKTFATGKQNWQHCTSQCPFRFIIQLWDEVINKFGNIPSPFPLWCQYWCIYSSHAYEGRHSSWKIIRRLKGEACITTWQEDIQFYCFKKPQRGTAPTLLTLWCHLLLTGH